jgi:glycosyltransferase involved in cell wall biosynthesis
MNEDYISNKYPLVSILCPTYNSENFIEKTLESILSQDYRNLEIIISDDASTDKTVEIIQRISKNYPRKIKLNINQVNLGITKNCNVILNMCNGKYIALFAGDDLMYPGKISEQVNVMEYDSDCSLSYHSVNVLDGDNNNKIIFTTEVGKQKYHSFLDIINCGGMIGVCSVMVRRDSVPPGGFSNRFPSVSDWLMLIEVALRGKIVKVKGVYGGYLRHSNGASRKTFETLGEIVGTLDYLKDRYGQSKEIISVANRSFNRYIVGEIARLFISGDVLRLKMLIRTHIKGRKKLIFLAYSLVIMINLNIHRFSITRILYNKISHSLN